MMQIRFPGYLLLLLVLVGCTHTPTPLTVFNNTQNNLKLSELEPTPVTGKNYQYCYGCIVYNYQDFGSFEPSSEVVSNNLLSAIKSQLGRTSKPDFTTDVHLTEQNAQAPDIRTQKTYITVPEN